MANGASAARMPRPRGSLTIAAPVLFGRLHVLPVVAAALREHPALSIRLSLSDRVVSLVEEGIDVAVRLGELPIAPCSRSRSAKSGACWSRAPPILSAAARRRAGGSGAPRHHRFRSGRKHQ
ncbi:MAG: LysR substrate-binding domain-containing protein [Aliidongia sp.]